MSSEVLNNNHEKRPGEPLREKPIQGIDGQWYNVAGDPISEDQAYSDKFWLEQPDGMREVMIGILHEAVKTGSFGSFASDKGINEKDKEKLSAYRVLAEELGYEIGQFIFHKNSHVAKAPMRRKKPRI